MASELKQNEEGMTDILQTNDSVLRVMDLYTAKIGKPATTSEATPTVSNGLNGTTASSSTSEGQEGAAASATATPATSTVASSSEGQATATSDRVVSGRNEEASALIDLADLNFDPTPISGAVGGNSASGGADLSSSTGISSLLDDLGALGKV